MEYKCECLQCGNTFITNRKKKYCSSKCSARFRYQSNFQSKKLHEKRICPNCKKEFISNTAAHIYCSRECYLKKFWITGGIYSTQENKESEIFRRVNIKSSQFEYIGGYTGADDFIYLICKDCGHVFRYSMSAFRHSSLIHCSECEKQYRNILKTKKHEQKLIDLENERRRKKVEKYLKKDFYQESFKICEQCGSLYWNKRSKYCSKLCSKKAHQEKKDVIRRSRLKNQQIDDGISLKKLYVRDKGVCYICGSKCNFEDYEKKNGAFVAGDRYPTKEHIIPLSKGGSHSWNNIKLACFRCNTLKRDQDYEEFCGNQKRNRTSS